MIKAMLNGMYESAVALNHTHIRRLVADRQYAALCDLGCDDGSFTLEVASAARSTTVFGVEIVSTRAKLASDRGIRVVVSDLNRRLPFADAMFDLVHANQVIEHVADIDLFVSEIVRVLRPTGAAIVSTENGSSWENIAAAIMGWQIFS